MYTSASTASSGDTVLTQEKRKRIENELSVCVFGLMLDFSSQEQYMVMDFKDCIMYLE